MKKPPSRNNLDHEFEGLCRKLMGAIPTIRNEIGSLLGRALPRTTAKESAGLERKLGQSIRATVPHFRKMEELKDEPPPDVERFAALDQLMTGILRGAGRKLRPGADPWEALLQLVEKQARPPRTKWAQSPAYGQVQQALRTFLLHLYTRATPAQIFSAIDQWTGTDDARRYLHSVRLLDTAFRRFRIQTPKRFTDRLLLDLQQEYTLSASIFESRLRILVFLAESAEGRSRPWAYWRKVNLHNLLAMAGRHSSLDAIVGSIDRNVRNALVHGVPVIDLNSGTCRFADLSGEVTWPLAEFFDQTRRLTLSVLAMIRFEPLQQSFQMQAWIRILRQLRLASGDAQEPLPRSI
jgi:hypothetical protein